MSNDTTLRYLEQLTPLAPDPVRARQVAAKCRRRIARRSQSARTPARSRRLEFAFIGALSVAYVAAVALEAVRILRLLQ